jgi:hypothetical protein
MNFIYYYTTLRKITSTLDSTEPKIDSIINDLNNAIIEIKEPEISKLYTGGGMLKVNINKLIESTVLKLKNLNK